MLPVGGIKEKVMAAHRMGMRQICIPAKNKKDVQYDVHEDVKKVTPHKTHSHTTCLRKRHAA